MSSKGRFRNGPESSAVMVQKEQRQTSGSLIPQMGSWTASPLARLVKQNCVLWSSVPNSKGNISPLVFVVFSPPRLYLPNPPYLHACPGTNLVFEEVSLQLAQIEHSQTFRLWTAHSLPWWLACSTSGQYDKYFHSVWRRTGTGQWPYCSLQRRRIL